MEKRKLVTLLIAIIVVGAVSFGIWFYFKVPVLNIIQKPVQENKLEVTRSPKFLFAISNEPVHPFDRPMATLAVNNKIYVSDSGKGKVLVFDYNGKFERYLEPNVKFKMPYGLAANDTSLYISDSGTGKIYIFDLEGNYQNVFEVKGVKLVTPAVLLIQDGILYVSDLSLHQVFAFDNSGSLLYKIGKEGRSTGELYFPHGLAVTSQNTVYVADSGNNRIELFPRDGSAQNFVMDQAVEIPTPRGMVTDWNGNIWIVAGMANQIRVYSPSGEKIFFFGTTGIEYGQLSLPNGIYIDQNKRIYVTEAGNKRISVFGY